MLNNAENVGRFDHQSQLSVPFQHSDVLHLQNNNSSHSSVYLWHHIGYILHHRLHTTSGVVAQLCAFGLDEIDAEMSLLYTEHTAHPNGGCERV